MKWDAVAKWVRGYEAEQARLAKVERAKLIIRSRMQCSRRYSGYMADCVEAAVEVMCPSCAAGQKLEGL